MNNHPVKGSTITVDPITSLKAIESIKRRLASHPLYYAIFVLGINTNLRASDLVHLQAGQVRGLKPMDTVTIREKKTQKLRRVILNGSCIMAINNLLASRDYKDNDPLLFGLRGGLKANSLNRLVKSWCSLEKLKGNFGSHTLRKTFGYHQHHTFHMPIADLMDAFNHSTQRETLRYLGITELDRLNIFKNEL